MNLPAESVAESAYRVFMTVAGHEEFPEFDLLEPAFQAQWEAVARHLAQIADVAGEDDKQIDLRALEAQFPAGWLPPRFRG